MIKDYYYSSFIRPGFSFLSPFTVKAIDEVLSRQACFYTYSRYRGYIKRVQSCGKVFLWKGFYHELTDECKNNILCLIEKDKKRKKEFEVIL